MSKKTMAQVTELATRYSFDIIDVTGGAPELNPNLTEFLTNLSPLAPKIILRCNLTALLLQGELLDHFLKQNRIQIVASFPSVNETQADSVRGKGVFQKSIRGLKRLNRLGYGVEGTGLTLDLVLNPSGAYLPTSQADIEQRFHRILTQKWGIVFNQLSTFANVPLGRFLTWLIHSGNFETYMKKLVSAFNPCAVEGLMCRSMLSVSWDGFLFDCDFNLAANLYLENRRIHVSQIKEPPQSETPIALSDHCYTCTAGSGFT
jgi:radical SAM/Cys-rich protein